jgi:hypothetical protein
MRNTKFKFIELLGALLLGIATSVFAQDTTYVWQSADGDPFNIQGTVVLDSPSSANGSATDVVSLSIIDTVDSYSWTPATGGGAGALFFGIGTVFAWNPSQILEMDIETPGYGAHNIGGAFVAHPGYGAIFDESVSYAISPGDQSGEWVAASTVPEPSALQLLSLAVPILIAVRRFAAPAARQRICRCTSEQIIGQTLARGLCGLLCPEFQGGAAAPPYRRCEELCPAPPRPF